MLRTALKPRWLALLAVLAVVVVAFTQLGLWQLSVARDKGRAEAVRQAPNLPVVDLAAVLRPHSLFPAEASGRRVRIVGEYAADAQLLVADRRLAGRAGWWVLTPLDVTSGGRIAVVRGFVETPGAAPSPPVGQVAVVVGLAPGESPSQRSGLPTGQLGAVDLAALVNQWPGELYNAFGFVVSEQRVGDQPVAEIPVPSGMTRVPPAVVGESGLDWRNAAYAVQWWIFAAFAVWMWWRMVREDHLQEQERRRSDDDE